MILFYHLSDWLPLAKQKSTFNFELEMLVSILLKFDIQLQSLKNEKDFNM